MSKIIDVMVEDRKKDEIVDEIQLVYHKEKDTDAAFCVSIEEEEFGKDLKLFWLPKSQCSMEDNVLTVPEWLAASKGFI